MSEATEDDDSVYKEIQRARKHIDLYRDTPIRLLGYANEVGEAFRSLIPLFAVRLSYVVAFGYVAADSFDKSRIAFARTWQTEQERRRKVALTAADTLVWQTFASVAIPGFTINRLCHFTAKVFEKTTSWPSPARKWATTIVGLGAIPFIVRPIDAAVELFMDETLRKFYELPLKE